jgi:hypothetical protein
MRTPSKSLHSEAPTPEARQALDDAWDIWDEAAHIAEYRNWESEMHNMAADDAWDNYTALKEEIAAGRWRGEPQGDGGEELVTSEEQWGDERWKL